MDLSFLLTCACATINFQKHVFGIIWLRRKVFGKNITSNVPYDVGRGFRILIKKTNYIAGLKPPDEFIKPN
jgi:hypothetical protein